MPPNNLTNRHASAASNGHASPMANSPTKEEASSPAVEAPAAGSDPVAATTTETEFLVKYEGEDYDIHDFLDSHPAGRNILLPFRNRDLTNKFHEVGHSVEAKKILRKYKTHKTAEDLEMIAKESGDRTRPRVDLNFVMKKLITPEDE